MHGKNGFIRSAGAFAECIHAFPASVSVCFRAIHESPAFSSWIGFRTEKFGRRKTETVGNAQNGFCAESGRKNACFQLGQGGGADAGKPCHFCFGKTVLFAKMRDIARKITDLILLIHGITSKGFYRMHRKTGEYNLKQVKGCHKGCPCEILNNTESRHVIHGGILLSFQHLLRP